MKKSAPLQIYLDSSDYSSFAEGKNADIYNILLDHVDNNRIEIRYSFITISEFVQTKKEHQRYAIKRAETINRLSRSKVLVGLYELILNDCIYFIRNPSIDKPQRTYAFRDHHKWFPNMGGVFSNFKSETITEMQEDFLNKISSITDRNQRAIAKSKFSLAVKNNNLTELGLTFTKGIENVLIEQLPISDASQLKDIFFKFMKGEISPDEFSTTLAEHCFNPVNLATWSADNMEKSIENLQWIRNSGIGLNENIQNMREQFFRIQELNSTASGQAASAVKEVQEFKFDYESLRAESLNKVREKHKKELDMADIAENDWSQIILKSPIGSIPSLDFLKDSFEIYVKQNLITHNRKLKPSDYGDIQHSVYIPYVDIFRTDKYMSQFYKPLGVNHNTDIASTLDELTELIDSKL